MRNVTTAVKVKTIMKSSAILMNCPNGGVCDAYCGDGGGDGGH